MRRNPRFAESTEASAENRDSLGRPLPKPPRVPDLPGKSAPRIAWEQMLVRGRSNPLAATISSLLRFRRLTLPKASITATREAVRQFHGQGFAIQVGGVLAWIALWFWYGLWGAIGGALLAIACYAIGHSRSKPWRCGNCKTPLATAKVRVCPGCCARLVDLKSVKVMPKRR
jgi:hypothetical protein